MARPERDHTVTELLLPLAALLLIGAFAFATGCAGGEKNPDFPLSVDAARDAKAEMRDSPVAPERPIVLAAGYYDPGLIVGRLRRDLQAMLDDDAEILTVTFVTAFGFEQCRDRLVNVVEERWPSESDETTVEVDVVAYSMGGLVSRYAAMPRSDGRQLRIARLFTISTPHRGARLAGLPTLDSRVRDMRSESAFLQSLDEHLEVSGYELYCYVRLNDFIVGEQNAAPPNMEPWWVPNVPFGLGHIGAVNDPRIQADIARRLRGERPWAGLPEGKSTGP